MKKVKTSLAAAVDQKSALHVTIIPEYRILLIEDDSISTVLVKQLLKEITSFKFHLVTALTLHEGCEKSQKETIDIVLLDLGLPDSDGKNTFDTLIKLIPFVPVVLVSALEDVELTLSLIREGAQDYVLKSDLNVSLLEKTILYSIERKKWELEMRENKDRLKRAELVAKLGNWKMKLPEKVIYFSDGARSIYGASTNCMTLNELKSYRMPEYNEMLDEALNTLINKQEPTQIEYKIKRKSDGKIIDILSRTEYDTTNQILFGVIQDITELKFAENKFTVQHAMLNAIIESPVTSIFSIDTEYCYTSFNKPHAALMKQIYGAPIEIGKSIIDYQKNTDDWVISKLNLDRALQGEQFVASAFSGVPGLKRIYVEVVHNPIFDTNNKVIGVAVFALDITDRKNAEIELESEKRRLAMILIGTGAGTWEWNIQTGETIFNERWAEIIGYTLAEIAPVDIETWRGFSHPDDLKKSETLIKDHFLGHTQDYACEVRMKHKNGHWIWVLDKGRTNAWDIDGKLLLMSGTLQDITERKQMEEKLLKEKNLLHTILRNIPDQVYYKDRESRFILCNQAVAENCGESDINQVINKTDFDFFLPELAQKYYDDEQSIMNTGIPLINQEEACININTQMLRYNNTTKVPIKDNEGNIIGIIGVNRDFTENKLAKEALKKSEHYLKETQMIAQLGTYSLDFKTGRWVSSPIMDIIFGIDAEFDRSTDGWISIIHPHWQQTMTDYLTHDVIGQKKEFDKVYKIIRKNNQEERWVHDIGKLIFNENNELISMIGTITDITIQTLLEIALIKEKEHAEESDRLKSAFLANMSHEIRTPMNGILGFAELLKEPKLSKQEQEQYIDIIEKSGIRMLNIINDIISISKVESRQMEIHLSPTNINEQMQFIHAFFKLEIEKKGMKIISKRRLPNHEALIMTDKEKVYAILTNLVKNAIKFTSTGFIEIGYERKDNIVEFSVRDTGSGIQSEQIELIFERFRQGSESLTRNYEGAGLGLSISKAYVEMLGGKIWVESEIGIGSTFYFTLPYDPIVEEKEILNEIRPSEAEVQLKNPKTLKMLLAEDDETSELLMKKIMTQHVSKIMVVRTGIDAVNTCRNHPDLDMVLMDIKMPEMDGYEATRQIRQFNPKIIIIAQTAFALKGDLELALAAGCNDYIYKPIKAEMLNQLIKKHFPASAN